MVKIQIDLSKKADYNVSLYALVKHKKTKAQAVIEMLEKFNMPKIK